MKIDEIDMRLSGIKVETESQRTAYKVLKKSIQGCEKIFKGNLPEWMVNGYFDVYERTKNSSFKDLNEGRIF